MNDSIYNSEEEYLKSYNSDKFEKLSITADNIIFSISDGDRESHRRLNKKYFSILLVKRENYPFKDKWSLPGGFVGINETTEEAARRILKNKTNLENIYMEQLYTFSDVERDPRMRVISTAYMSLINKNLLKQELSGSAKWFNITLNESNLTLEVILESEDEKIKFELAKVYDEKSAIGKYSYKIITNDSLAFDHALAIGLGISRLKNKVEYTDIIFNMMPSLFTLGELQQVYEVVLGKKLLAPAFRRIIAEKVVKTNEVKTGEGHRPSALYRYKK